MKELEEQLGLKAASEIQALDERYGAENKPQVVLPGGAVQITATAEGIARSVAHAERVFSRDGGIWHVRKDEDDDEVYKLHPVNAAKARSLFEDHCRLVKQKTLKDGTTTHVPEVMAEATAKAILESEAFINGIFEIAVMSKVPFPLVSDEGGFRLVEKGYDEETKTLVCGNSKFIRSDLPIEDAVSMIRTLYAKFNFVTESDEARCIACLLTPAFRRAGLLGNRIPMEVSEADRSQSGKTLLQQVKAAVYGDKPNLVQDRKKGVGSTDENFSTALLAGCPFVLFDNYRGKLNITSLESFLTADGKFDCRGLRKGGAVKPENYFLGLTSNGVQLTTDLANRSCFVRIRKQPPHFDFGAYDEGEFIDFVRARYEFFLTAVYSILMAWNNEGRPQTEESRHSFRPWARSMDWIVQNYFGLPPLLEGHQDALERTVNPNLQFLRALVIKLAKEEDFQNKSFRAAELAEKCSESGLKVPGLSDSSGVDTEARNMALGKILGQVMNNKNEISLDGFTITRTLEKGLVGGSHGDKEFWKYRFSRL